MIGTAMLENLEFRSRLVKTRKNKNKDTAPLVDEALNPQTAKLLEETGKRIVKSIAVTVVAVYATVIAIDTLSKIVVKKTKSADQE